MLAMTKNSMLKIFIVCLNSIVKVLNKTYNL